MEQLCAANNKELILRYFELQLLNEVGYRPQLRQCVSCQKTLEPVVNSFCPGVGGMLCPHCSPTQPFTYPLSLNAQKVLRLLQNSDYNTVNRLKIDSKLSVELEKVMCVYLKYLLEREIKSAAWMDALRKEIREPISSRSTLPKAGNTI